MKTARWAAWTLAISIAAVAHGQGTQPQPAASAGTAAEKAARDGVMYLIKHASEGTDEEKTLAAYALSKAAGIVDVPELMPTSRELTKDVAGLTPQTARVAAWQTLVLQFSGRRYDYRQKLADNAVLLQKLARDDGGIAAAPSAERSDLPSTVLAAIAVNPMRSQLIETADKIWTGVEGYARKAEGEVFAAVLLQIAQDALTDRAIAPRQNKPQPPALERWLAPEQKDFAMMWVLSQYVRQTGRHAVGETTWRQATDDRLARAQNADGSWPADGLDKTLAPQSKLSATAFAVIMLAENQSRVGVAKFVTSAERDAGAVQGRDADFFAQWLGKLCCEYPMDWWLLDAQSPAPLWHDARVLFIAADDNTAFSAADIAAIKAFVRDGGLVVSAEAEGSRKIGAAIERIMRQVVENKYEPRPLPQKHTIVSGDGGFEAIKTPPSIVSVSNGVRELWVHTSADLATPMAKHQANKRDQLIVLANAWRYAVGPTLPGTRRAVLNVAPANGEDFMLARLAYAGNADPEPMAFRRFAAKLQSEKVLRLGVADVKIGDLQVKKTPVAHMTGTASFTLNETERAALRAYLADGGTLLIDSAGGSKAFSESVTALCGELFKELPLEAIPINESLFSGKIEGTERIESVDYRKYAVTQGKKRSTAPALKGIRLNGRWAVIFSDDDLVSGLLDVQAWGIVGLTPESSQQLMQNLLLYTREHAPKTDK